jgi:TRAP-type uncharacterized transport system substrate-binding protein
MAEHIVHALHDEWIALLSIWRFQWPLVLLFFVGLATLLFLSRPFPPHHVRLATGQPGSSLELLGQHYQESLARHGISVELVETAGAFENVQLLKQGKVDLAFSLGGMNRNESPSMESLGSVEYQPLWFFHRESSENPDLYKLLSTKKVSINLPGSGTYSLTEKILSLYGINVADNARLLSISSGDSVEALLDGRIDAMFLVADIKSSSIQRLSKDPKIKLLNFDHADTYAARFKFLEPLKLPRGALDMANDIPAQHKQLVATTTTILMRNHLHPAIQYLFLSTARKSYQSGDTFFSRSGGFPDFVSREVPLSPVADRFYQQGEPILVNHLPYWFAVFLDQFWFILFALFAVGYPLVKILPNYRVIYSSLCISDCFDKLRKIDSTLGGVHNKSELEAHVFAFEATEHRIYQLWVPAATQDAYFKLRNALEILRKRIDRMKAHLSSEDGDLAENNHSA